MTVAVDTEIAALMRCLQGEREHVLGAVDGLSDFRKTTATILDDGRVTARVGAGRLHDVQAPWDSNPQPADSDPTEECDLAFAARPAAAYTCRRLLPCCSERRSRRFDVCLLPTGDRLC